MDNRDDLRKSPRTPEEILATGAAWISELELDYIIKRLATAEAERDQAIREIGRIGRELGTCQYERDRLKTENERLRKAIQMFSDKWKYYNGQTITGLDDLRAALRREG